MFDRKPVVAFGIGGIPEVVRECCPLYPFGYVTAAAAGFDTLVDSPDLARELAIARSNNSPQIASCLDTRRCISA